jgi:hypothetical protein
MEKLLSTTKKQGGKYATNLNRPAHKKYFLSYGGHENIFCQRHNKQQKINLIQDVLS